MNTVMNAKQNFARRKSGQKGFSLIEVTISIAITAVALVSLMGMLPAGMRIMREAGDRAVETRIHQQILGELQLAEWDDRLKYDWRSSGKVRFYDDQGIQIVNSDPLFDLTHVYTARINVPAVGQSLPKSIGATSYNGVFVPGGSLPDLSLQLVIVEISSVIDEVFEAPEGFNDDNFLHTIRTFQATIVKMGKEF